MLKSIFFDFDGVLSNTFSVHLEEIRKFFDCDLSEQEYRDMHNGNFSEHTISRLNGVDWLAYRDYIHSRISSLNMDNAMKYVLENLKERYAFAVVSSGSGGHITSFLEKNGVENYFDEILGVEFHTSKKEKFQHLLLKYDISSEEALFVTDTLGDILEANEIGIPTVAVMFGFHNRETLKKGNPLAIIERPKELLKIVKEYA
jgi:HAD superfamily hydrolase (TIGR01509 family)